MSEPFNTSESHLSRRHKVTEAITLDVNSDKINSPKNQTMRVTFLFYGIS